MNSPKLMRAVCLYAKMKKKKRTGRDFSKMKRVLALSKKTGSPEEISMKK